MTLFDPVPETGGPAEGRVRVKLVLAYDGTDFHGFAPQPAVRTVGGELAKVLEKVLRRPVELTCAGRTDAGVHAAGQVVTFDAEAHVDIVRLRSAVNGILGPEVVVRDGEVTDPGFDARFSARWRSYRYTVVNRPEPDPFLARYAWWVPDPLRITSMQVAADAFLGEHDFASFCRAGPPGSTTVRRVLDSAWRDVGDGILRYDVTATAFCWQMVRSLVGTLVDVGADRRKAGEVISILRARDRQAAGRVAPARGLCLHAVGYS